MIKKSIKFKINVPKGANIYAEKGDKAKHLLLYEAEELEILERIEIPKNAKINYQVKDGQFINKGETLYTEGILSHKAMVADHSGILEISDGECKILGHKNHLERKVDFNGEIIRILPDKFIEFKCDFYTLDCPYYYNFKTKLTNQVYFEKKEEISIEKFPLYNLNSTYFINDNLYLDELAKLSALGAKKVIVNGIFVSDIKLYRKEVEKFESFCVISGFGEFVAKYQKKSKRNLDILWGKSRIYFSEDLKNPLNRIYEHPFWGVCGSVKKKNELIGELDYNHESIEFYLKNYKSLSDEQ